MTDMDNSKNDTYHIPVLLRESVDGLGIKPGGIYVDVTFGGGGHSREILSRISGNGHLYSFDQDATSALPYPTARCRQPTASPL